MRTRSTSRPPLRETGHRPQAKHHTTLLSAAELAAGSTHYRILDCRAQLGNPHHGLEVYTSGHIKNALYASLDADFAAVPGSGGRHPLPVPEILRDKLRAWGIDDDDQIVLYDDAGGAFAARAWWCIRWLGHEAVALLDGGLSAWPHALTTEVISPAQGSFSIRPSLTKTIDATTLERDLDNRELIDARTEARWAGMEEPIDPVAGHIPGALCRPFQENLAADGTFKPAFELRRRFESFIDNPICYCGSGVTAAHNVLAMRIAGLAEPTLYPGSWSEWILNPERPRSTDTNSRHAL
ncbi:MAG: sulfurtransferase [Gammaproteobacteria bacterium]|nr:MAG: sulfurtransferase [Gammaproteobacteria bacterium]